MDYVYIVKLIFSIATNLGMNIGRAKTSEFVYLENKNKIQKYFQENKSLNLIIVIIPDSPKSRNLSDFSNIYSKHIFFVFFCIF